MVTTLNFVSRDNDSTPSIDVMDPWGEGVDSDASANRNNALGFDDNFSDASDFTTMTTTDGSECPPSSQPPLASTVSQVSPINFIPNLSPVGDDSVISPSSLQPHSANLLPAFPPLKDPLTQMMSSEEYVSRLEAKLRRIKGGGGKGGGARKEGGKGFSSSARQMIDALSTVKESHVLLSTDGSDAFSESSRMDINPNFLMQRAFPDRTALTQEELEWLVKHDQLQPPDDANNDEIDSGEPSEQLH